MTIGRRIIHLRAAAVAGVLLALPASQASGQQLDSVLQRPRAMAQATAAPSEPFELRLTLEDAVALAAKNNLDLAIERRTVSMATDAVAGAEGAFDGVMQFRPRWESATTPVSSILQAPDGRLVNRHLGGTLSYTQQLSRAGSRLNLDFDNSRIDTSNSFTLLAPYYTSRLSVAVVQPLLRGFRTDAAKTEVALRRNELEVATTAVGLQLVGVISSVEDAYWDLVAARQEVDVRQEAVALAEEQLDTSRRLLQIGALAQVELSGSEAELEGRRDDLLRSIARAGAAENQVKLLLGGGIGDSIWNERIVPVDTRPPEDVDPAAPLAALTALALERRLELRELADRTEIVATQKRFAADRKLPDVSLVASYGHSGLAGVRRLEDNPLLPASFTSSALYAPDLEGNYGQSLSNMLSRRYQTFQVGLSIDLTVRNRAAEAQHSRAVIAEDRLRLERRRLEQIIYGQVRDAVQAIDSARQRVAAAEASTRAAREKLDSETRLFRAGESTSFMVLTRQNELAMSRLRAVQADVDLSRALARLRRSVGETLKTYGW